MRTERLRLRAAVPTFLLLTLAACGSGGTPDAAPSTTAGPPTTAPSAMPTTAPTTTTPPTSAVAAPAEPCEFVFERTADGSNRSRSESNGGSLSMEFGSDRRSIACAPGPRIPLRILRNAVEVSAGDGAPRRLRAGQSADVGPYQVTVVSSQGVNARVRLLVR